MDHLQIQACGLEPLGKGGTNLTLKDSESVKLILNVAQKAVPMRHEYH
jgi:hypothetical protein